MFLILSKGFKVTKHKEPTVGIGQLTGSILFFARGLQTQGQRMGEKTLWAEKKAFFFKLADILCYWENM